VAREDLLRLGVVCAELGERGNVWEQRVRSLGAHEPFIDQ
jgi:hypothetical protein